MRFLPKCIGYAKIKPRREGGSERALCIGYEETTRGRGYHMGLQANDDKRAGKNFKRLVKAHKKMIWFFQPIYKGSDNVAKELHFDEPEQKLSQKNFKEVANREKTYEPLGGYVDFMASSVGQYDGDRLRFFFFDEIFKIFRYNPMEQLEVVSPTLQLRGGAEIVGKMQVLSTVEEYAQGKSVEYARKIWDDSDIASIGASGRTATGLLNYFRSAIVLAEPDEWGFPQTEKFLEQYHKQIKDLTDKKNWSGLTSFKRKFPLTLEDSLSLPSTECILFPALIEKRISQVRNNLDWYDRPVEPKTVKGDLIWESGVKYGRVRWIAHEKGKWSISQQPIEPNAGIVGSRPKNWKHYSIGIDPVDSTATSHESTISKMGITVFRKHNPYIDNESNGVKIEVDNEGNQTILNPDSMQTNKPVCIYRHREENPDDALDDIIKTLFYYSAQGTLETNRAYARNRFRELKLNNYLTDEPLFLRSNYKIQQNKLVKGINANVNTNNFSNEVLIEYAYNFMCLIDFIELLEDMRSFSGTSDSRTKNDLVVSFGWALTSQVDPRSKIKSDGDDVFSFPNIVNSV